MKIRHRLAVIFTLTLAGVLILLSLVIYFFSRDFHNREFFQRLETRAVLTEKFFLEEAAMPTELAQQVRSDFLQKLPEEREWLLDPDDSLPEELVFLLQELQDVGPGEFHRFHKGARQGVARIYYHEGFRHLIVVTALDRFGISKLANLRRILFIVLPLALFLAAMIGWMATKRALTPLEGNIEQARQITASNLGARLALPAQKDEIHDFASIFNDLLERLEKSFAFQRTFISNASHEIRNPLTVIAGEAEIALSAERSSESYRKSLEVIALEADRMNLLVNNLLSLARTGGEGQLPDRQEIALGRLLAEIRRTALTAWPHQTFRWPRLDPETTQRNISCNLLLMRSALVNLLDNACKYGAGKPVSLEIETTPTEVCLLVRDEGIGIPSGDLPMVLVPLFRASNARAFSGHGIGLPLVDRIAQLHGGRIDVSSEEGAGTIVRFWLRCERRSRKPGEERMTREHVHPDSGAALS
jgi:signal transduction histidine kinase